MRVTPLFRRPKGYWFRRALVVALVASGLVVAEQTRDTPQLNASSCGAGTTPSVTALANPNFYIDTGSSPSLNAVYAGYTLRTQQAETNLRIELSNFTGDKVSLATGQPGDVTLPIIASGATHTQYFLLTASGPSTTPQTHTISLYRSTTLICSRTFTFTRVEETIKALANKVDSVSSSTTTSSQIGDVVVVTVEGRTGTIGAGPSYDPGVISYAPTAINGFPAGAWELEKTELLIKPTGTEGSQTLFTDRLYLPGASGPDRPYTARYYFRAVGYTTDPAVIKPIQYIASGTQIKHTDVAGSVSGSIPPPSTNATLTMTKTADPSSFADNSGAGATRGPIDYTVVIRNLSGSTGTVDRIVDTLPAGITFISSSATTNPGCAYNTDPTRRRAVTPTSTSPLTFLGPFTVAAGSCLTLRYQANVTNVAGTYTNSVVGYFGSSVIDGDTDVSTNTPATATVTIARPASVLVANNDEFTATAGVQKTLNVQANDTVPVGATMTIVRQSSSGTASVSGTTILYTPDDVAGGTDTFEYRITDGDLSRTATVTVKVPKTAYDQYVIAPTNATQTLTVPSTGRAILRANDTCSTTTCTVSLLTISSSSGYKAGNSPGALTLTANDGSFTFVVPKASDLDGNGIVNFTYRLTDGDGNTATGRGRIVISDFGPDRAVTPYKEKISIHVSANDSCPSTCSASLPATNPGVDATIAVNSSNNQYIDYTPNAGFAGVDSFTYTKGATDGTVTVLVGLPSATITTSYNTPTTSRTFGSTSWITEFGGSLGAFSAKYECSGCTYSVTEPAAKGTVDLNSSTGAFTYTPKEGEFGEDPFDITVTEPSGLNIASTVTIKIGPKANNDSGLSTFAKSPLSINVLTNDVTSTGGRVTSYSNPTEGSISSFNLSTGAASYVNNTSIGPDSFTYTITDDTGLTSTATVSITVEGAENDSATTSPGVPVNINVRANDPCDDCSLGTIGTPNVGTAVRNANGTVTYIPPATFSGIATFTYSVTKGSNSTSATVTVNVKPDAIDDSFGIEASAVNDIHVLGNDICAECTITSVGTPSPSGSVAIASGAQELDFTAPSGSRTYTFTYTITDSTGLTDTATVTLTVADPPVAVDDSTTTAAGTSKAITVSTNDTCTNTPCTYEIFTDPENGVAIPTATAGVLQYTPKSGFTGTDTFTYIITTPFGLSDTATVTIDVTPTAANDSAVVGTNSSVTIDVQANDVCLTCSMSVTSGPDAGSTSISGNSIIFTSPATPGTYTFVYRLTENDTSPASTADATVTVIVGNAAPDARSTAHNTAFTLDVIANDTCRTAPASCTIFTVTQPAGGSVVKASSTEVTFTPTSGFQGLTTFTYTARYADNTTTATATVTVLVGPAVVTENINKNETLTGNLKTNSPTFDCTDCTYSLTTPPTQGEFSFLTTGGSYSYVPRTDWQGTDSDITYTITDPASGLTTTGIVRVTVDSTYSLSVTKSASAVTGGTAGVDEAGDTITYTYVVTNDGDETVTDITVTDDKIDNDAANIDCPVGGTSNTISTLAATASVTCQAVYTLTQADIDAGRVTNTVTVSGTGLTAVSDTDTITKTLTRSASMTVAKVAGGVVKVGHSDPQDKAGDTITYTYTVTNTGNVTLTNLTVTDNKIADANLDCAGGTTNVIASLAPGARESCQATYTIVAGDLGAGTPPASSLLSNTVTVNGTAPDGASNPAPASETITVLLNEPISLTLAKSAGSINTTVVGGAGDTRVDAGDTIPYTFTIRNTSDSATLTNVTVTDPLVDPTTLDCSLAAGQQSSVPSLAVGESATCTATLIITQAQIDSGQIANNASVAGSFVKGLITGTVGASATATTSLAQTGGLSITNTFASFTNTVVGSASVTNAGDAANFTYVVTNAGNVTFSTVSVSGTSTTVVDCDSTTGGNQTSISSLAPGASRTCTAVYTVTQPNIDAAKASNTATATSSFTYRGDASATSFTATALAEPAITQSPSLTVTNTFASFDNTKAGNGSRTDKDDWATFTYEITNTGNVALSNVTVTADDTTVACSPIASLAIGDSATCTGVYTLTQADIDAGSVSNTVTATSGTASDSDTATASITQVRTLTVDITGTTFINNVVSPPTQTNPGDRARFTYVVTNTGNVTLAPISVSAPSTTIDCDSGTDGNQSSITTLAPGGTWTCYGTYTITDDDNTNNSVTNTVTATSGSATDDDTVTVSQAIEDAPIVIQTISMTLGKAAGAVTNKAGGDASVTEAGDTITYTYTVTNTGNVTLTDLTVTDDKILNDATNINCAASGTNVISSLGEAEVATCTATYTLTQADIDSGNITNIGTLAARASTGTDPSNVTATESVTLDRSPNLSITNTFSSFNNAVVTPNDVTNANDTASFTYVITNTGNVTLTSISVSGTATTSVACSPIASLAPGASATCTGVYTVTSANVTAGTFTNTATASTTFDVTTVTKTADASATPAAPSLTVTNTFTSFDQTIVAPNDEPNAGDTATFTYVVTNTGNVTLTSITLTATGTTISCSPIASLAPAATATCTGVYALTSTDDTNDSVSNTVTAQSGSASDSDTDSEAWTITKMTISKAGVKDDSVVEPTDETDAGDTITYTFTVRNTGNVTFTNISVTDNKIADADVDCDGGATNVIATLAPGATATCSAVYTVTSGDVSAGSVTNVATATAAGPTSTTATVSLTVNMSTGTPAPTTTVPGATPSPACAIDDRVTAPMGAILDIDVTANDPCLNLTVVRIDQPSQGTAQIVDNKVRYTPDLTFMGTVTMIYDVSNGSSTSSATITVDVTENWIKPDPEFYLDVNANSTRDPREPGVIGVPTRLSLMNRVVLSASHGTPVSAASLGEILVVDMSTLSDGISQQSSLWDGSCTTDDIGKCTTGNVPVGVYWVQLEFDALANKVRITEEPDETKDLGALTWPQGELMTRTVFGVAGLGAITGRVFIDENGNAIFDPAEDRPLPNREVRIVWAGLDGLLGTADDVRIFVNSNQSGIYRLNNAPVGRYRVVGSFSPPDGMPLPPRHEVRLAREQTIQIDIPVGALSAVRPKTLPKGSRIGGATSASAVYDEYGNIVVLPGTGTSHGWPLSLMNGLVLLLAGGWLILRSRRKTA